MDVVVRFWTEGIKNIAGDKVLEGFKKPKKN